MAADRSGPGRAGRRWRHGDELAAAGRQAVAAGRDCWWRGCPERPRGGRALHALRAARATEDLRAASCSTDRRAPAAAGGRRRRARGRHEPALRHRRAPTASCRHRHRADGAGAARRRQSPTRSRASRSRRRAAAARTSSATCGTGSRRSGRGAGGSCSGLLGAIAWSAALGAALPGGRRRSVPLRAARPRSGCRRCCSLTGAHRPDAASGEMLLIAVRAGPLALATDRLLPWPRAIALPAAIAIGAARSRPRARLGPDPRSLLGPNPILGARFYGVGNELEVTLGGDRRCSASAPRWRRRRRARLAWGFAGRRHPRGLCAQLGQARSRRGRGGDAGRGAAAAARRRRRRAARAGAATRSCSRPRRSRSAVARRARPRDRGRRPLHALGAATPAGWAGWRDVAQRRVELSYNSLGRGIIGPLVLVAAAALVWGVRSRERLLPRWSHCQACGPRSGAHWWRSSWEPSRTTQGPSSC